jgi:hypothetical protein
MLSEPFSRPVSIVVIFKKLDDVRHMIYLSTAIEVPPGGSGNVHIYTQTIYRTKQLTTKQHKQQIRKSAGRAESLRVLPWHSP